MTDVMIQVCTQAQKVSRCLYIYLTKSISRYTGESFDYRLPIPNTPLQKEDCNQNSIDALVSDCKSGLREIPLVQIHHCYCEANKCADALARRGALLSQDFVVFLDPPADVAFLHTRLCWDGL